MKRLSTTVVAALFACKALGQIGYTDLNPDKSITSWDSYIIHPAQASATLGPSDSTLIIWYHPTPEIVVNVIGSGCEVLANTGGNPLALDSNVSISSTGNWIKPSYAKLNQGGSGEWVNKMNKFLGVRFKRNGQWHYSWVRLSIDNTPTYVKIHDYAYRMSANAPIKAGQRNTLGINDINNKTSLKIANHNKTLTISGFTALAKVSITDLTGRVLLVANVRENEAIDLHSIPSGIYVITAETPDAVISLKAGL